MATESIYHVTTAAAWDAEGELITAASLESEGFIHCSTRAQLERTLRVHFAGQTGLVVLEIDPRRVTAELRWELADGMPFPHVYGPIPRAAVVGVER